MFSRMSVLPLLKFCCLKPFFCLPFLRALWIGELVVSSQSCTGGLFADDVVVFNGTLRVRITHSKMDIFWRGEWPIYAVMDNVCPVHVVTDYLAVSILGNSFLVHYDCSAITRYQFTVVFCHCLSAVGLQPIEFGTPSFWIGAAMEAARVGLTAAEVQRIGRWKSACDLYLP